MQLSPVVCPWVRACVRLSEWVGGLGDQELAQGSLGALAVRQCGSRSEGGRFSFCNEKGFSRVSLALIGPDA